MSVCCLFTITNLTSSADAVFCHFSFLKACPNLSLDLTAQIYLTQIPLRLFHIIFHPAPTPSRSPPPH